MKRHLCMAIFLCVAACSLRAQTVDTTVCDVLKNPHAFNGKTVRIKGTVLANFDEFVIRDGDCENQVNGIWLAYPEGSKAKAGPLVMMTVQPAKNCAGKAEAATRAAVTLQKDKEFKQFDSALNQWHKTPAGMCLGCQKNEVQATLVGRLDTVDNALIQRNASGKIVDVGGFGNANAYQARLVIQSVSDVTTKGVDYSKVDAIAKEEKSGPMAPPQQGGPTFSDPLGTAVKMAAGMSPSPLTTQIQNDLGVFPKNKEQNGVTVNYNGMNESSASDDAPSAKESPDGVIFNCYINRDRLDDAGQSIAYSYLGQQVQDARAPQPGNENAPLYIKANNAWAVAATMGVSTGVKYITLPGGYLMWNSNWPDGDKVSNMMSALNDFLSKEEMLSK
jgi:hypothetical protein